MFVVCHIRSSLVLLFLMIEWMNKFVSFFCIEYKIKMICFTNDVHHYHYQNNNNKKKNQVFDDLGWWSSWSLWLSSSSSSTTTVLLWSIFADLLCMMMMMMRIDKDDHLWFFSWLLFFTLSLSLSFGHWSLIKNKA